MPDRPFIRANSKPTEFQFADDGAGPVKFTAAAKDAEGGEKLPTFSMLAYTGGKMDVGFGVPVVVDLSGLKVSAKSRPILLGHDPAQIVGHTTEIKVNAGSITASGTISGSGGAAQEVVGSSKNGFPWQASIGASVVRMTEVDRGESVQVNGRTFRGPLLVARQSNLKEISFVPLGADDNTSGKVAASGSRATMETITMDFEQWLAAMGLKADDLTDDQVAKLKAKHKAEVEAAADDDAGTPADDGGAGNVNASADDDAREFDADAEMKRIRAEHKRMLEVEAAAKDHPEIAAKAIDKGWDAERTKMEVELADLRASRPKSPNANTGKGEQGLTSEVVEAAVCMAGGLRDVDKEFDEKTLDAAHKRYRGRIGLQELLLDCAMANGYSNGYAFKRDPKGVLQAAFSQNIHAAGGFSTLSITDILSNTANKFLIAGFNAIESTWRQISGIGSVSDFKQITRYRLTGDMEYDKVGAGGEIKHGTLADQTFNNQADTYAKMLAITRQDQINDDLGALTAAPQRLGRGAALKLNSVFWTAFLANTSHFHTNNNNLASSNPFSIDGLTAAELKFFNQTTPENADGAAGVPLGINPAVLLVPNALHVAANQAMNSTNVNELVTDDDASSALSDRVMAGNANPHAGKFRVVRSSYLSNSAMGGAYSTSTWYLLADPSDLATIETVFLNGQQSPTVETADADFNTLGIQMRGYHDFGVALQDPRAGVKSTA